MAIVLPEDRNERKKTLLKIARGQPVEFTVGKSSYVVKPRAGSGRNEPPKQPAK